MSRNDYRDARKQRNLILEHGLDARLVAVARAGRVSVNEFVVRLIEEAVGDVGECGGRAGGGGVASEGGGAGAVGGRVGDGGVVGVSGGAGRSVDWDAILQAGRSAKPVRESVRVVEPDPLDVIA